MSKSKTIIVLSPEILCRAGDIVVQKRRFSGELLHRSDLHLPYPEAEEVGRRLRLLGVAEPDSVSQTGAFNVAIAAEAWANIRATLMAEDSPAAATNTPVVLPRPAASPADGSKVPASPGPVNPPAVQTASVAPQACSMTSVPIDSIDIDDQYQLRVRVDPEVIEDYAELMGRDEQFPPILLMTSGDRYILVDGRHRLEAARRIGRKRIDVEFTTAQGSMAVATALRANAQHGRCLTPAEKRDAVARLLADPNLQGHSNEDLARLTGLSATFVGKCRRISAPCGDGKRTAMRNGKQYTINTSKIGKRESQKRQTTSPDTAVTHEPTPHNSQSRKMTPAPESPTRDLLTLFDNVTAQLHDLELALKAAPADSRLAMSDRAAGVLSRANAVSRLCRCSAAARRKAA